MKKIELGQAIQTVANFGLLVGIALLVIELSQNSRSTELAAYQDLMTQIARVNELVMQYPQHAQLASSYTTNLADLDPLDRSVAVQFVILAIRHGDMAWYQYERGAISEERFESATAYLRDFMCRPVYSEIWISLRDGYVSEYREYVDSIIDEC